MPGGKMLHSARIKKGRIAAPLFTWSSRKARRVSVGLQVGDHVGTLLGVGQAGE